MAGYSGTPLIRKLGLEAGAVAHFIDVPKHYWDLLGPLPEGVRKAAANARAVDFIHLFVMRQADLTSRLGRLKARIAPAGMIWVSWPKKAAKVPTDVTEDTIRAEALRVGLVDVKVCAVDAIWSGLKLVIRKHDRA